jgi:hypothetical protein
VPPQLSDTVGAVQVTVAWQEALAFAVMFEGHPAIRGLVLSWTITLKEHVDVFPAASEAVYVTMVVPKLKIVPGFFVEVSVNVPPQLSETVGAVQLTVAWQDAFAFTVMLEGHPLMTGLVLSWTITLNEQVDVFPAASVAVYVTSVVPRLKIVPGLFVVVSVSVPPQLSDTVGAVQFTVAWQDAFAFTFMFEGHPAITGSELSWTITLKEQMEVFPAASVAVYVTSVVPRSKTDPGAFVLVRVNVPPQLSDTVGVVQLTVAWQEAFALTVMLEGHPVITGFVLSWTITLNEQVDVFPSASVAVYVTSVVPRLKVVPGFCVAVSVSVPPQLSDTVGAVHVATAWQEALAFTVMFEGHPEITGRIGSLTITLKEQVEILP